jgi:hypothetical protein
MSLSVYEASVPVFVRNLNMLDRLLDKAAAFAEAKKIEPSVLLNARLAPDMYHFARQIQGASDAAKAGGARLAGIEPPSFPDTETTLPELHERIAKTIAFLNGLDRAAIDAGAERNVVIKGRSGELKFTGASYLLNFALPNFMFHVTVAYAILRHNGLEIGKLDFLGPLPG